MDNREKAACAGFVDYMTGETPEVDRKRFERHLLTCAACREDAAEWRLVWDQLADEAPPLEPPADLKGQVMDAIFNTPPLETKPPHLVARPVFRFRKPLRWIALAAAMFLAFFAGSWWNQALQPASEDALGQIGVAPSQIEKLYRLEAVSASGKFKAGGHAYGVACLIRSDGNEQLVVYVFGSPKTEGNEAYQVWLMKDGKRSSAGIFTVGSSGIGLLTMPWTDKSSSFDTVGVTLEPDTRSSEPRGPKLFGSV
ncbi:MAG: hypothetical protein JWR03_2118 [Cohnella sp.]|nr:hypothetical protein [Cohnella sp.]